MTRLPIVVREAVEDDAADLIALWSVAVSGDDAGTEELARSARARTSPPAPAEADTAAAVGEQRVDPYRRFLVALLDGRVVGAVSARRQLASPLQTAELVVVSDVRVDPAVRRRYVASVLMSAVVSWAEETDCDVVLTVAGSGSRNANRFLTRLGFGQVATVRAAQTSALRSRFSGLATSSRDTGRMIAVRRTMRRREAPRQLHPGTSV